MRSEAAARLLLLKLLCNSWCRPQARTLPSRQVPALPEWSYNCQFEQASGQERDKASCMRVQAEQQQQPSAALPRHARARNAQPAVMHASLLRSQQQLQQRCWHQRTPAARRCWQLQRTPCCRRAVAARASLDSAVAAVGSGQQDEAGGGTSVLQELLVWLVQNGVSGVGSDDSAVALYEDDDGERGIIAVQDIAAGSVVLRVPLRLAITDVMDEQQRQSLVGQGALWQDRLVAKLLVQLQQGTQSPWHPYLQALPRSVPSALESFSDADARAVQVQATTSAIEGHADKMAASWAACRPDAIGGASLEQYRWAHSVVMSRTFGNASESGGIGVRMLVPLIDLLNHAGDESSSGLLCDGNVTALDNVRWDVVSPQTSGGGEWEMVLSATQDVAADSPLLLSYAESRNDEWLLHYGFVPRSNPHDTVQLFSDVGAALEHLWRQDVAQGKDASQLAPLYQRAHDAGLAALQQEVAAAAAAGGDDISSWGPLLEVLEPIQVASGSRVSESLIAALEVLHGGDMAAVEAAVAALAWRQLAGMQTSLLHDLALLTADASASGDAEGLQLYARLLRHYTQAMVPAYAPELLPLLQQQSAETAAAGASAGGGAGASAAASGAPLPARKKKAVPGPAAAAAAAASGQQQPGALLPLAQLVRALLCADAAVQSVLDAGLHPPLRLAVKFRVSKKMLLADVVLAARAPLAQLQQQQAAGDGGSGECGGALPWQQLSDAS